MAFVIIRNPKTGGTSVTRYLVEQHKAHKVEPGEKCRPAAFRAALTEHKILICEPEAGRRLHAALTPEERREHTWVGLMRNPYARFISGWQFCMQKRWIPFDSDPLRLLQQPNAQQWRVWLHCCRPQVNSLYDHNEQKIPSIVLHTETLDEDFHRLADRMELTGRRGTERTSQMLRHDNKSDHHNWRHYYLEYRELRGVVDERMALDINTLPYNFEQDTVLGELPREVVT